RTPSSSVHGAAATHATRLRETRREVGPAECGVRRPRSRFHTETQVFGRKEPRAARGSARRAFLEVEGRPEDRRPMEVGRGAAEAPVDGAGGGGHRVDRRLAAGLLARTQVAFDGASFGGLTAIRTSD